MVNDTLLKDKLIHKMFRRFWLQPERSSYWRDNLANQPVEIGIGGPLDVQVATANVVDGLVVDHEGTVWVLKSRVSGQDRVVRFDDRSGNLGCFKG